MEEIEKLSELGVLFLLFEMGLELTIDKLRVSCMLCSRPLLAPRILAI